MKRATAGGLDAEAVPVRAGHRARLSELPRRLLDDSPISLDTASGVYLPQNYDKEFKGLVSVRTALASSLERAGGADAGADGRRAVSRSAAFAGLCGITQPGDFYGYALALGAPEVSLWEQVQAYRMLARGGESGEYRFFASGTHRRGQQAFPPMPPTSSPT